jgi:hypothetical protein
MREVTARNIDKEDVGQRVQIFVDDGATKIVATPDGNGAWTVVATFSG